MHTKVKMAGQPVTTPSTLEAIQGAPTAPAVQPSVVPTTPKQTAAQSPKAATCTQQKTLAPGHVQPLTSRTDVTPC